MAYLWSVGPKYGMLIIWANGMIMDGSWPPISNLMVAEKQTLCPLSSDMFV